MELSTIVVIIGSIIVYQSHRQRKKIAWFAESVDMTGKVALITGSSSGIGFSTALHLAKRGATVVLLSRHDNGVTRKIMSMADNDNVHFIPLDLGSMVDIKSKCDEIKLLYKTGIDALINCAGTAFGPVENSADGLDYTYQVNHFGPQQLIENLMPLLELKSGRIVTLGSKQANKFSRIDINSFSRATIKHELFERLKVYMQSKLLNTAYALALADELSASDSLVTVNIGSVLTHNNTFKLKLAYPGLTQTNICCKTSLLFQLIWTAAGFIFFKYPAEGAQSVVYCALSAELKGISGKMISECREDDSLIPIQAKTFEFRNNFLSESRAIINQK